MTMKKSEHKKSSSPTKPTGSTTSSMKNNVESTRVCIKNIPPSCTESNLQSHLLSNNKNGHNNIIITDCKILRTKDGKSRKLAFVGFKSPNVSTNNEIVDSQ